MCNEARRRPLRGHLLAGPKMFGKPRRLRCARKGRTCGELHSPCPESLICDNAACAARCLRCVAGGLLRCPRYGTAGDIQLPVRNCREMDSRVSA